MRRHSPWLLALLLVSAAIMTGCSKKTSQLTAPDPSGPEQRLPVQMRANGVPDAYIVVFDDNVADVDGTIDEIGRQHGIRADYRYRNALKGFAATMPAAAVDALSRNPNVRYIEQDQLAHADATQNNPTWGLDRIDQRTLPLSNSYTYNQTGAGVDVYILDTGIHFTHVDFGGRAVTGFDAITPGGTAADDNGHGTHVAGTSGGTTWGVAKGVNLIAVKVLNAGGSGTFGQVIAGVDWVTGDHTTGPAVANMSLTGGVSTALNDAVLNSINDGVTYSVAAGNNASNVANFSPASVPQAITVAASSITDGWASFSNFGAGVDIIAPGVSVTSAWWTSNTATNTISGTSMATPHVTGVSALFLETNPSASPAAVASALTGNGTSGVITGVPAGTVNLLLYSLFGPPPPGGPPPAPTLVSPADGARNASRSPTLVWNASTGATSYRVQVSLDPTFATTVFDQSGITGTSVSLSNLAGRTVHYWHVNASNADGTSAFSETWSFRTRRN